jgi:malate dehydrogenase (oxaloacetate-decarboxylating)
METTTLEPATEPIPLRRRTMDERPYQFISTADGPALRVRARGTQVLSTPMLNRGTAYTLQEREALGLVGLLPDGVSTIEQQVRRVYAQYTRQQDDLAKHVYLSHLRDRNEILFYRLLSDHLHEMLPIVYTPTVGEAIQRYSHEYRRPRGVFLSVDHPELIEQSLCNYGLGADDVDLIVATDSEGILGIGDWGVGGIEIAIGKLSLYIAAAGMHPRRVIPVVLDMGTNNLALLNDPMYLGARHSRVSGDAYDEFVDAYVTTASKLFPKALLHWEDLGAANARRVLDRYKDTACTFNDDMQGTAAVVLAAALSGLKATGRELRDQRVVIHGSGTAGTGIADMIRDTMVLQGLSEEHATRQFWCLDRDGLLLQRHGDALRPYQRPYARPDSDVADWARRADGTIALDEVVRRVNPSILIGTSTQPGAFSEDIVRGMAGRVERPIIMPLSNPTSKAEAIPADLLRWTGGRAMIATGSPFGPVTHEDTRYRIAQSNNALVFPGLGLGVMVTRASRVTERMLAAAADSVAELSNALAPGAPLLPPMDDLRTTSATVAVAVANAAVRDGVATVEVSDPIQQVYEAMWSAEYPRVEPV